MFKDDIIDLVLTILILGVVISVGLNMAVNTEKKAREDSKIIAEDKNTKSLRGYGIDEYGDFDGYFTVKELALMIQVQDYGYIPGPRKVTTVDNTGNKQDINIVSTYKDELAMYGKRVLDILTDINDGYSADTKYSVRLGVNESADGLGDTYIIEAVID